jgi:hypothetical protein
MPPVQVALQDYYGQLVSTASGWMCEVSATSASGISSLSGGKAVTDRGTAIFADLIVTGTSPCQAMRSLVHLELAAAGMQSALQVAQASRWKNSLGASQVNELNAAEGSLVHGTMAATV